MATRNLTQKFESMRADVRKRRPARRDHLLPEDGRSEDGQVAVGIGIDHSLPPDWVDILENIQKDLAKAKESMKTLQTLHGERLKVQFGEESERAKEQEIDIMTQEVTRLLKKCETNLKKIAHVGNAKGTNLAQEERVVRLNVMRAMGSELQTLSKQFRHMQKDFMERVKGQEDFGGSSMFGGLDSKQPLSIDDSDQGFTSDQLRQLDQMKQSQSERDQQILRIAQSVNELAAVFRELNVLVIEQGTILDRIDYNIEQTLVKVKEGVVDLQKAEDYSKKARSIKCIGILLLLIIILGIILGVKNN